MKLVQVKQAWAAIKRDRSKEWERYRTMESMDMVRYCEQHDQELIR